MAAGGERPRERAGDEEDDEREREREREREEPEDAEREEEPDEDREPERPRRGFAIGGGGERACGRVLDSGQGLARVLLGPHG